MLGGAGTYRIKSDNAPRGYFDVYMTDSDEKQFLQLPMPDVYKISDTDITNDDPNSMINNLKQEVDYLKNKQFWKDYDTKLFIDKILYPELYNVSNIVKDDYITKYLNNIGTQKSMTDIINDMNKIHRIVNYEQSIKQIDYLTEKIGELEKRIEDLAINKSKIKEELKEELLAEQRYAEQQSSSNNNEQKHT